jgi:PAS domain S-box-containing protein
MTNAALGRILGIVRRMLRPTVAKKVGLLLCLFAVGVLGSLFALAWFIERTAADGHFLNVAGRQRFLLRQLQAATDAEAARETARAFERALQALERGGRILGRDVSAPAPEVASALDRLRGLWEAQRRSALAPWGPESPRDLAARAPALLDAAEAVIASFQHHRDSVHTMARWALWALAAGDVALFALGIWLTRRYISRPVRLIDEATRRVQAQDFTHPVPVVTRDELAILAARFNEMSAELVRLLGALEARRRDAEAHLRALLEHARVGLFSVDPEGVVTFAEGKALQSDGLDLVGRVGASAMGALAHAPWLAQDLTSALAGEEVVGRGEAKGAWYETHYAALRDEAGSVTGVVGLVADVTERRRLEEELRQSQKLEALGTLAGGVAHDFNNLLTAISGFSELLLRRTEAGSPIHRYAEQIHQAGARGAALTTQLLAFGRRQILRLEVLDLGSIIGELQKMLQRLLGEDLDLAVELPPEPVQVYADRVQIEQVLMNLAVNAREAMPQGGHLFIRVAAHRGPEVPAGEWALLEVRDSGRGMDEATKARIFEPFFSTKEHGTGLGLSTVYGIVTQSGGQVRVESAPGQGATFRVLLPRVFDKAAAISPAPVEPSPRGAETILLVEDEDPVRALAVEALELHGYKVLAARDGPEALVVAALHPGPIDLLLTDVVMPRMGGQVVAERLAAARPGMRVLYVSGYPGDRVVREGRLASEANFLAKPFTPETLAKAVHRVLHKGE